jgi:hypothetical protein
MAEAAVWARLTLYRESANHQHGHYDGAYENASHKQPPCAVLSFLPVNWCDEFEVWIRNILVQSRDTTSLQSAKPLCLSSEWRRQNKTPPKPCSA